MISEVTLNQMYQMFEYITTVIIILTWKLHLEYILPTLSCLINEVLSLPIGPVFLTFIFYIGFVY